MADRVDQEPVYILHRRRYRESSYILDLFSLNYGRVSAVLRASSSTRGNPAAQAQIAQSLLVSWTGRSSLKTLTRIESPMPALALKTKALYCAYYVNELVLRLLPEHEANQAIFVCYTATLERLSVSGDIESSLRYFELWLLQYLGISPDYSRDLHGVSIQSDKAYRLELGAGFVKAQNAPFSGELLSWCAHVLANGNSTFSSLAPTWRQQCKRLMRLLIDDALQGKSLNSRAMIRQLFANQERGES